MLTRDTAIGFAAGICLLIASSLPSHSQSFSGELALDDFASLVKTQIDGNGLAVEDELSEARLTSIGKYYEAVSYAPIWIVGSKANAKAHALEAVLSRSYLQGLSPSDYDIRKIRKRLRRRLSRNELAELEVDLTRSFVAFADNLVTGQIDPDTVSRKTYLNPRAPKIKTLLDGVRSSTDLLKFARDLEPNHRQYRDLVSTVMRYRHIAANGGWIKIRPRMTLRQGDSNPAVRSLRARLTLSGDLAPGNHAGEVYDARVAAAIKTFQARHGLKIDGVLGPDTKRELNVSVTDRIIQLELNLERWRWLKDGLGSRYLFANIANQSLQIVEGGKTRWRTPLVVGKPFHATPVFTEKMEYIVINPNWNIPRSIAINEMLPKLRRDPGALAKKDITIKTGWGDTSKTVDPWSVNWRAMSRSDFRFRLQQGPGPRNALGRIKFMFPNRHSIYIHDTPSKNLFKRNRRAFSHGCMRVQFPLVLAKLILDGQGWSHDEIKSAVDSGQRRVVSLRKHWPVYVMYLTAWVDEDGTQNFRRDIYGRDKKLLSALRR